MAASRCSSSNPIVALVVETLMTANRNSLRTLLVDTFTDEPLSGVATGVVPDAEGLSSQQLQAIAIELGAGETAFVRPSVDGERRVRTFTPAGERERSTDAIIAAYAHRHAAGEIDAGSYVVDTANALVDVEVDADGTVWVGQPAETLRTVDLDYDRVGMALGIDPATLRDVGADLPSAVASVGEAVLLVPVNFLSSLSGATPDRDAIITLSETYNVSGIYGFTFDTLSAETTVHARAFTGGGGRERTLGPLDTATAAGACAAYLQGTDAFDDPPAETVIEQGHFRDRASRVSVQAGDDPVLVGGRAVTSLDGELVVPEGDDDDIVEA